MPGFDDTGGPPIPGGGGQQQGGGGAGGPAGIYGFSSPSSGPLTLSDLLAFRRRTAPMMASGGGQGGGQDSDWMTGLLQHIASHPAVQGMVRAYRYGGTIREPVAGVGLRSGSPYSFGEDGPEQVTPSWMAPQSMAMASGYGAGASNPYSATAYDPLSQASQQHYGGSPPSLPGPGMWGLGYRQALEKRFPGVAGQAQSNYIREQVRRQAQADALARQGASTRLAGYFGGNDPAAAGYAQLESQLHGQSDVANALSEADLRLLMGDEAYERQKELLRLQAALQPQQNDLGSALGGIGGLVKAFIK
jgi:hypothetical protein